MPSMDGFEATKRIVAERVNAPVVVVSSSTDPGDVKRALEAGAAGCVPKERAVAELSAEVSRLGAEKRQDGRRSLSLFFVRRLVFG
jgi:DNA-binding NarL/FixJ family response regulator